MNNSDELKEVLNILQKEDEQQDEITEELNNNCEQNKSENKKRKILAKYGLNDLDSKYADAVRSIQLELASSGLSEFGNLLAPDSKTAARVQIQLLNSLVQQNWIIIRQLNEINKKLENE